jgi:hypothetical protein
MPEWREPYQLQVRYACEDIVSLRARVSGLETDIELRLNTHQVGKLLTTIPGVSALTAARIIAETGDPAQFRSAAAFASYIGAAPRLHQSGKKRYSGKPAIPLGNARLRRALRMPVLVGIRLNPWLRTYYLTPAQRGQTSEGRHHSRDAQTAHRDLQRRQTSKAICSPTSCYVALAGSRRTKHYSFEIMTGRVSVCFRAASSKEAKRRTCQLQLQCMLRYSPVPQFLMPDRIRHMWRRGR